ncbi:MAG: PIN domain-containing protein [Cyanobacteria bacterium J06649_4]
MALAIRKDKHHLRAIKAASKLDLRQSPEAQNQFIDGIVAKRIRIFTIQAEHVLRISQLMRQYADLPMDLADASLVVLAEHLNDGRILSTDQRDFNTYRWKNREPFENLMFPTT